MNQSNKISDEVRILAAMAYGEASSNDVPDEMAGLAKVLVRQRDARGYADMSTFVTSDKTFSFVVKDGNARYKRFMASDANAIAKSAGMNAALRAANEALSDNSIDPSNGGYFWDGADIKSNYKKHFKVKHGIRFSDPAHNIYAIAESTKLVVITKTTVKKKKGKWISSETVELARYDHIYVSTAAHGGTIFWKHDPAYTKVTGAKDYK
jgi:hypothetical protein